MIFQTYIPKPPLNQCVKSRKVTDAKDFKFQQAPVFVAAKQFARKNFSIAPTRIFGGVIFLRGGLE